MSNEKVSRDVAEQEFERFCDAMDLDVDLDGADDEEVRDFNNLKNIVIKAMVKGSVVINENGEPEFTPQRSENKKTITFYEPEGSALMSMDRRKKGEDVAKTYTAMANATKTSTATFANMKYSDLRVCQALFTLFLA